MMNVLEISSGVAPSYAAKLLADAGANVTKVEPPAGDPLRDHGPFPDGVHDNEASGYFIALNLNKRSVVIDDTQLMRLLAETDVLVYGLSLAEAQHRGLDAQTLREKFPSLVILSLTPFGHSGPYAEFAATELIMANAGGWANLCPATHDDPDLAPLKVIGDQCHLMSAIAGATTALAVFRDARRSGVGEHIDFSIQEYVASVLEVGVPSYSYKNEIPTRCHQRGLIPWRIFEAKDAPVFIVCIEQDQWERLVEFMGTPEWTQMETFADQPSRKENQDLVHLFVQEFVADWHAEALYHAAQEHRICVAPVLDLEQFAKNEHLIARDFFTEIDLPQRGSIRALKSSVLSNGYRTAIRLPSPKLGEHTEAVLANLDELPSAQQAIGSPKPMTSTPHLPLAGIRVLDMTWAWAGPFCSLNLAHLGAEVIRLESALRPDLYRRLPVHPEGEEETLNTSGMFNQWNQGKSSIAVNLRSPEGIDIVKALVAESDVVVQNFATGVMERMGIGYETLKALNPEIILASISGYGQTGPYKEYMGYGPAIPPLTGLSAGTGYVGGGAEEIGLSMPDPTAGITAAYAICAALLKREQTSRGEHIDVSLWEATAVLNAEAWMGYAINGTLPERMGNRSDKMSPHGVFRCHGEDRWIALACCDDQRWQKLAALIDADLADDARFRTLADRKANEDALESIISVWTADQDRWTLTRALQSLNIPAFPSLDTQDIVDNEHLNERGFIEYQPHPEVGRRAHTGVPWRLDTRRSGVAGAAPCLGADTDRLLSDILDFPEKQLIQLRENGIIGE
jgi:crotonobetainyl-CoA:carnitine CoA-transferase CaiB-like acyl-CoA transferase